MLFALLGVMAVSVTEVNAQVINDWSREDTTVVTNLDRIRTDSLQYAAKGILSSWEKTVEECGETTAEDVAFERKLSTYEGKKYPVSFKGPLKDIMKSLPYIPGDEGENLFLLTRDGIEILMTLDYPAYFQEIDDEIVRWVRYYAHKKRANTKRIFARYRNWEPRIKSYFQAAGVPPELAELCLIESGCTYSALSPAGALGMWQIMPATGRAYGMQINAFVDERTDPVRSTTTAAKILASNYRKTSDWTLAAAAYNCGPNRFKPGMTWNSVRWRLPKETQQYIPALIAIHYVWTYKTALGF